MTASDKNKGISKKSATAAGAVALAGSISHVVHARASGKIKVGLLGCGGRGNGAVRWGDHHPCLFTGTEWFFRTGYRAHLTTEWIPALEGVEGKLREGALVADIGCGSASGSVRWLSK